jgi:hypothetical protein
MFACGSNYTITPPMPLERFREKILPDLFTMIETAFPGVIGDRRNVIARAPFVNVFPESWCSLK